MSACKLAKQMKHQPVAVNDAATPCVEAVAGHVELCYDASDYPADVIMQALQGKHSHLAGMFEHSAGDSGEVRSGEGGGWTEDVLQPACGGNSEYIRPRVARNSRGRL